MELEIHSESFRKQMTVKTTTKKLNAQWIEHVFPEKEYSDCPGVLVNTNDFFISCRDIGAENNVIIKLIGKFGLELSVCVKEVVETVSKLGHFSDKDAETLSLNFHIIDILRLKKLQSVSQKLRIYLKVGMPMMITAMTQLGPAMFFVKSC